MNINDGHYIGGLTPEPFLKTHKPHNNNTIILLNV
jgi:hypothetical protein